MATHESRNDRIFAPAINGGVTNALKTFFSRSLLKLISTVDI